MQRLIYSITAAALLAGIATIGFTPAQATITAPDRNAYGGSSATPVHCQKEYHCHWRGTGANRKQTLPHLRVELRGLRNTIHRGALEPSLSKLASAHGHVE